MRQNFRFPALLFMVLLIGGSCDLPEGPEYGKGTITLLLPKSQGRAAAAYNKASVSRSVLADSFTGSLVYRLTLTGPGGTQTLEAGGGGTTLSLDAGQWTVEAKAYKPGASTLIGSGSAVITVVAGQSNSVRIPMSVNPVYEAGLTDIYIHNEEDLRRIGTDFAIDGTIRFYLERDIVLTQPWTPIGSFGVSSAPDEPFKAEFDGQGHTITIRSFAGAVKEASANTVALGFFALVKNAEIKNTSFKYELGSSVDISTGDGSTYYNSIAGGVAGSASDTAFENIQVTGNFSVRADEGSSLSVGGIAGQAYDVTITGCHVSGAIGGDSANYLTIGGIAGYLSNSSTSGGDEDISGSSFTGTVAGNAPNGHCEAGGIAGVMYGAEITACFAEGSVTAVADGGDSNAGGIAGNADSSSGSINKSYAEGAVKSVGSGGSYSRAGGIAGISSGTIETCYAAGTVESVNSGAYSDAGGIAGKSDGLIENCYAWAEVSTSATYEEAAGGIAGINDGTISTCYAAGTVRSKETSSTTFVGGIAGRSAAGSISGCVALVSELRAGVSDPVNTGCRIAYIGSSTGNLTGNFVREDMVVYGNGNSFVLGPDDQDGEGKPLTDFKSQPAYDAGWDFTGGAWKFLPGYDYPVLVWQIEPPEGGPDIPPAGPIPS